MTSKKNVKVLELDEFRGYALISIKFKNKIYSGTIDEVIE